jgi:DNA-binding CsgD family transcriptional regulator
LRIGEAGLTVDATRAVPPHAHTESLPEAGLAPFATDVATFERARELKFLEASFERARTGRGAFVILDGSPGSGRSRLLEVAAERASVAGMRVLTADGHEPERDLAFGGALQLFEGEVARADPSERARLLSGPARLAEPLLARGPHNGFVDEPPSSLLHALYRLCCNLSDRGPLLLAVDDGHAVDEATLHLLLYLSHRLGELPAVVLLAANVGAMPPELGALVRHPRATVIRLRPLDRDGTARWLRATAFPEAATEFCNACHEATGGDRYLLRELARELSSHRISGSRNDVRLVAGAAPRRVAETVLGRLARLGTGAVELAEAIVTLGGGAELRHAAGLAGLDPEHAAALTERLVTAGVLRGADRLAFAHPLVARALDVARTPTRRAASHLAAAQMLRDAGAADAPVADQLMQARRTGTAWVVDVLERAAATARAGGAPERAARYLRRALAEPPEPERRRRLVAELGRAEASAGAPEALDTLRRATDLLDPGFERATAALWMGRVLLSQARFRPAAAAFRAGLEDTADLTPSEPLPTQLAVSQGVAARLGYDRPPDPSPEIATTTTASTPEARLAMAHAAFEACLAGTPADEVRRLAVQALGPGLLVDEEGAEGLGAFLAAAALTFSGDLQSGEAVLTAAIERGRDRGSASGIALAHALRAGTILRRGRLRDALADLRSARLAHSDAWRGAAHPGRAILALVHLERDATPQAAAQLERWERSADPTSGLPYLTFLITRGRLRRLEGRPEEALADLLDCGRRATDQGCFNPAVYAWRSQAALAELALGRRDAATALAEAELELARAFGAPDTVGHSLHVLGTVVEGVEGLRLVEEAAVTLERSQAVLALARALIDYGAGLRKASRRKAAREPLRRGVDLARRCHADALVRRGLEELTSAGAKPRRSALSGAAALTTRERQVAQLAGEGHSNREISEALVVTLKTVEWHLRQAYRKLGIESRRQLADALEERD